MAPGRKLRNAEEARQALAAVERAGVPRAVWAHANQINARSLNAWRLILARSAPTAVRLVELVAEPEASASRPSGCTVRCRDVVVELDTDFDDDVLVRVLQAVRRC